MLKTLSLTKSTSTSAHACAQGLRIAAAITLGLTVCGAAMADTWRWKDENGRWVYSERRPPGVDAERLNLRGTKTPQPDGLDKLREKGEESDAQRERASEEDARAAAIAANEKIAKANCETAKTNLQVLKNNRIVTTTDGDGNQVTLDEAGRQEQIAVNEKSVAEFCN